MSARLWIPFLPLLMFAALAPAQERAQLPPVSVADTLAFREITAQRISPAGDIVAFVSRVADLERKCNRDTLQLVSTRDRQVQSLATADEITHLYWGGQGRNLFALFRQDGGQVLRRFDPSSGAGEEVWRSDAEVDQLAISPDGTRGLVVRLVSSPPALAASRMDFGLVYEYGHHDFHTIGARQYDEVEAAEFLVLDFAGHQEKAVGRIDYVGYRYMRFAAEISIAPDNRRAAVRLVRPGLASAGGTFRSDIGVLDLQSGAWKEAMPGSDLGAMGATWLGGSQRLFFVGRGQGKIYDITADSVVDLPWAKGLESWVVSSQYHVAEDAVYLQFRASLWRVSLRGRVSGKVADILSASTFDEACARYAFVSESSEERPEIAVADLPGGAAIRLTDLNPYLDDRALGHIERIKITNAYGVDTTAYLLYPVNYEFGKKYPLVLASYGFKGRFILTAEWHTTFPAQVLAGQGYAVLMVNTPPDSGMKVVGDTNRAREREGWQVLSCFETAVQMMMERGIADPARLGLYGWSHGAFIVEFLLAHSRLPFKAACVGEGGDYNPSGYWIWGGKVQWPEIYQNIFGGPFTARTAAAYLEFSPVLSVDRVNTPLLMEFVTANGILGLEFLVPLRERRVPAEMVLYDKEAHNFLRPTVRFASMNRKLDWFNYWMLDQKDPDPQKAEQYVRWEKMKQDWATARRP